VSIFAAIPWREQELLSMKRWWCLLCSRPTRYVGFYMPPC